MSKIYSISRVVAFFILASLLAIIPSIGFSADLTITPVDPDTPKPKVLWERTFVSNVVANGFDLVNMPDGGVLVALPKEPDGSNNFGVWITRLDSGGKTIWEKLFVADSRVTRIYKIRVVNDSTILVACDVKAGQGKATYPWLMKISFDGEKLWQHILDNRQCPSSITDFIIGPDGMITFIGVKRCFSGEPYKSVASPLPWIGKMTANGTLVWEKVLTEIHAGGFLTMIKKEANIIAGAGTYDQNNICRIAIASFSLSGKLQWIKLAGKTDSLINIFLAQRHDGSILLILPEFPQKEEHSKLSNLRLVNLSGEGIILDNYFIKSNHWKPKESYNLVLCSLAVKTDNTLWMFGCYVSKKDNKISNFLTHLDDKSFTLADYVVESKINLTSQRVAISSRNNLFLMFSITDDNFVRKTKVLKVNIPSE